MAINSNIIDGNGKGYKARISSRGELITAPLAYSEAHSATAALVDTAYNLITPKANQRFVITAILLTGGNDINAVTPATITLYEAVSAAETTVSSTIISTELAKNATRDITGINLIVSEGKFLNIKTSDATVIATLLGYYIDA